MTGQPMLALALVLAACGNADVVQPSSAPLASADRSEDFVLEVSSERSLFDSDEAIPIETTLTYEGEGEATVWGSGYSLVGFMVERLDDGLTSGPPISTDDCAPHEFESDVPVAMPFAKSGAYSEDTPNADFIRRYLDDPDLHLPAGTWRITATATGYLGETCGPPELQLETSIEIQVVESDA